MKTLFTIAALFAASAASALEVNVDVILSDHNGREKPFHYAIPAGEKAGATESQRVRWTCNHVYRSSVETLAAQHPAYPNIVSVVCRRK